MGTRSINLIGNELFAEGYLLGGLGRSAGFYNGLQTLEL